MYLRRILATLFLAGILSTSPAFAAHGVVLNFNEVDIATMVKFISDLTGKNFVMDDRVKGKISVYSPAKLTIDEAYNVFTSVLEMKGFTVIHSGKVLKIVPTASAKTSAFTLLPSGKRPPVNDSYVAQVIKLENISAQEALTFLQPLVSKDGAISAFGSSSLLVLDGAINLGKIQDLLKVIDTAKTREGVEIVYLKNAAAESTAKTIQQWLSGSESKAVGQPSAAAATSSGGQASVLADQRLNALLVFGSDSIKQAVREMAAKLDVASPEAGSKVNVYYLENTDATEMAKVLEGVIKGMSATATAGAGTGQGGAAASSAPQASVFGNDKVSITADKASNSLVIMASPADYTNLLQVIKKLDRRSKQVFVQVLIFEVTLSKSGELGAQLGALGLGELNSTLGITAYYDPFSITSSVSSAVSSLSSTSTLSTPVTMAAVIKALSSNTSTNVLSTPTILTSDNKEAEIVVGQNVPFTGSSSTSSGVTTTSVERKDVGITLKIKPQISEGDYIRMDLSQEISSVSSTVTVGSGSTDRITNKRTAKTNVVVKDNQMIVIGGMIQDQDDETESKVPLLGDIPGLGWLFKTKTKSKTKTNLIIMLTPHIIKDNADLAAVSDSQRGKFGDAAKKVEPVDVQKEIGGK
ncbi:type II secretion system protein GspD [Geobacter sp. FeAm09]|nr:type II secretion system protein GspD [Geobacter sp. FeAm09]